MIIKRIAKNFDGVLTVPPKSSGAGARNGARKATVRPGVPKSKLMFLLALFSRLMTPISYMQAFKDNQTEKALNREISQIIK